MAILCTHFEQRRARCLCRPLYQLSSPCKGGFVSDLSGITFDATLFWQRYSLASQYIRQIDILVQRLLAHQRFRLGFRKKILGLQIGCVER